GRMRAGPRTTMWLQLLDALGQHPWIGWGWNQVSMAQLSVAAEYPDSRYTQHSHNLVLNVLLENGVPLGVLLLGTPACWLAVRLRRVRALDPGVALLGVLLLLAHAMVEFPLSYLYFLVPFGIAIGIVEAHGTGTRVSMGRLPALAAAVLLVVAGAWAAVDYWRVEDAYRRMRMVVAHVGLARDSAAPERIDTQFTQLAVLYDLMQLEPGTPMTREELQALARNAERYPLASVLYRVALAQALHGDVAAAQLNLRRLKNLHGEVVYQSVKE